MVTFEESGMTFSFKESDIFYIEKSERFSRIEGAKPCECVVLHDEKVYLIEAKSSSPRPANAGEFATFVDEIAQKFNDSYTYYNAAHQKRQQPDEVSQSQESIPLARQRYEFCLIINGHQREWLLPMLDQLKSTMKKSLKLWGVDDACVKVVNEQGALGKGLIVKIG
jgi:hypothetical protein